MKNNIHNLQVGQTVYRPTKELNAIPLIIKSIGNKYFEVEGSRDKIELSTLNYSNKEYIQWGYQLYLTEQEIHDKKEYQKLYYNIKNIFGNFGINENITLDQVKRINKILNES